MTISEAAKPKPIARADSDIPFIDPDTGLLTPEGLLVIQSMRVRYDGASRLIACNASTTTNVITLTPVVPRPLLEGYRAFDTFVFVADATSDGTLTATVVPETGSLATLKVYKDNGATQATTGDVVSGSLYHATFSDHLDTAAGGLVLK